MALPFFFKWLACFIFKYRLVFSISIVVAIGAAGLKSIFAKKYYNTSMFVISSAVETEVLINKIKGIAINVNEGNDAVVASMLGISTTQATLLKNINIEKTQARIPNQFVVGAANLEDTIYKEGHPVVKIETNVFDSKIIPLLNKQINAFIEHDAYISEKVALKKAQNIAYQEALVKEIEKLEMLQTAVRERYANNANISKTGGQLVFMNQENAQPFYGDVLSLQKDLLISKRNYPYIRSMTIIQPFFIPEYPEKIFFKTAFKYALLSIVLVFIGLGAYNIFLFLKKQENIT